MKTALITGVNGQDGSYLAELLLEKGYQVHGTVRRSSSFNRSRIDHLTYGDYRDRFKIHYSDVTDSSSINGLVHSIKPDEIYNLAAQSHVKISFDIPEYTANVDAIGTLIILEAVKVHGLQDTTKIYQASTSELYGKVQEVPQNENTPFYPRSPYGVAKLYGYWIVKNFREAYGMFACNGILFNHESPRRGENFVTRKITNSVAKILTGKLQILTLGNLDAKRDWGFAKDYVVAMWLMLQQDKPEDFVIASGETHSVRDFVEKSFNVAGIEIEWRGKDDNEKGYIKRINSKINSKFKVGDLIVKVDKKYYRPTEVDLLHGDPTKAKDKLGWEAKVGFDELVKIMVDFDLQNERNNNNV